MFRVKNGFDIQNIYLLWTAGGGTRIWKWGVCAYRRMKQGTIGVGFCKKRVSLGVGFKKSGLFWCKPPKVGGNSVYILSNLNKNLPFSVENGQKCWNPREAHKKINPREAHKKIEILRSNFEKKGSLGVDCIVKNGVIWCKICEKGVKIQVDNISRHMGVPPPPGVWTTWFKFGKNI